MAKGWVLAVGLAVALSAPGSVARPAHAGPAAPAAAAVDYYITGSVVSRVAGRNQALVEISWAYKCLGDQLGEATYDWSLELARRLPKPEQTTPLGTGTSKRGSMRRVLGPGQYEPIADPFRCETDRGVGSTTPEVGRTFIVPDYCAWTILRPAGQVALEQRRVVKSGRAGDTVRPGDVVVTGNRSSVTLESKGRESKLALGAKSRGKVDTRHCGQRGGWKLTLSAGTVTAEVSARANPKSPYVIESPNAVASGAPARWTVSTQRVGGKTSTRVRVLAGRVTVGNLKGGRRVVVPAGRSTTVSGSAAPS